MTQEELRRFDAEEAADRKPYKGKYHVVHSSGSTGTPGYFLYDTAAWNSMLLGIIRGALWGMSMPQILALLARGPRIAYIAATDGRYGGAMAVGDGIDGVGAKQMYLDIKTPLAEWARQLRAFRPNIIIGYPSAIKILAELVERDEVDLKVVRVISCGEPLGNSLRKYLEDVFQTRTVNFYGASESLALGAETDPAEGMLLFDDMNIIEAGEDGIYLTCLYNFAQPLIRYRLSDRLAPFRHSIRRKQIANTRLPALWDCWAGTRTCYGSRMWPGTGSSCIRWPWRASALMVCWTISSGRRGRTPLKCLRRQQKTRAET